jgi:hypothetical protein
VINAFNTDKPYSRFVEEQLAGDVLFPDEPEGVVATGFIAAGPWDYVGHVELPETKTDGLIARYNDRDDMIMTTMSTFLSLTVHCARCHDHKFDPISQREYYALQAVFAGIDRAERPFDLDKKNFVERRRLEVELKSAEARHAKLTNALAALSSPEMARLQARKDAVTSRLAAVPKPTKELKSPSDPQPTSPAVLDERKRCETELEELTAALQREIFSLMDEPMRAEWKSATNHLESLRREFAKLPAPQMVYGAASTFRAEGSFVPPKTPRAVHLLKRGDVKLPGDKMQPGALSCVPGLSAELTINNGEEEGNPRAALARWLTDPRNQLTRRSIVNRVWHYHFGRGIVDTPNDFGHMGGRPTHPELLDWLAAYFLEKGESFKELHRLILTSATYRQSSAIPADKEIADQENHWLGRMNRQRLDAETIRDAMLSVAGALDLAMGGPSVQQFAFKDDHSPVYDYSRYDLDSPGSDRRSIYRFIVRSVTDPFMDTLDCPDPSVLADRRTVTTTALQALAMLNDPFVFKQAARLAARVSKPDASLEEQVNAASQLVWNRDPTEAELRSLCDYSKKHGMKNLCRVLFNSSEFIFVD